MTPLGLAILRHCEDQRLEQLSRHFTRDEMRIMWDNLGDNSFFGPYDCADIRMWMSMQGDGSYCAI